MAALVIAGLGYWDSHRERAQEQVERAKADRERAAEAAAAARERQEALKAGALKLAFLMTGTTSESGDRVRLTAVHGEQVIQTQTVWFPTAVRKDSAETTGNPRVEAGWLGGLSRAAGKTRRGRMPVAIETTYIEDGQTKTDRSIYWLGYNLHGRLLQGSRVELEGLSLARRGVDGDLQAAADALWARPQ